MKREYQDTQIHSISFGCHDKALAPGSEGGAPGQP